MGFRFRRRTRLFPGLSLNWSARGLSSISIGGSGATINVPIARSGGTRQTVGIPGTGVSYSEQAPTRSTWERRQQQRPNPPFTQQCVDTLNDALGSGPGSIRDVLWEQHGMGLIGLLQQRPETPRDILELTALLDSADRCELHIRRGRSHADTVGRLKQITSALQQLFDFARKSGLYQDEAG